MLQWKASNKIFDMTFDELMLIVKDILPKGNELPASPFKDRFGDKRGEGVNGRRLKFFPKDELGLCPNFTT
jgi:hypothetical protein